MAMKHTLAYFYSRFTSRVRRTIFPQYGGAQLTSARADNKIMRRLATVHNYSISAATGNRHRHARPR